MEDLVTTKLVSTFYFQVKWSPFTTFTERPPKSKSYDAEHIGGEARNSNDSINKPSINNYNDIPYSSRT